MQCDRARSTWNAKPGGEPGVHVIIASLGTGVHVESKNQGWTPGVQMASKFDARNSMKAQETCL
jgi:hypothetical protein